MSVAPAISSETGAWAREALRLVFGELSRLLLCPKPSMCVPDTVRCCLDGGLGIGGDDGAVIDVGIGIRS